MLLTLFVFFFQESSYNGGGGGGRERSLESKSPASTRHPSLEIKKAKLEEPFSPQMIGGDPYGLYLYQQWAAATHGKGGQMHPAAAAAAFSAFSNHYAQAVKVSTYIYYIIIYKVHLYSS